jgi:hypothetical protein
MKSMESGRTRGRVGLFGAAFTLLLVLVWVGLSIAIKDAGSRTSASQDEQPERLVHEDGAALGLTTIVPVTDLVIEATIQALVPGGDIGPDLATLADVEIVWKTVAGIDGGGEPYVIPDVPDPLPAIVNLQDIPATELGERILALVAYDELDPN